MATQDTHAEHAVPSASTGQRIVTPGQGILQRLAQRRRLALVSPRRRRRYAQWLRQTAWDAEERNPIRRRNDVLLHYRAAAVRTDLLEIAALLEQARDPDVECVVAVRELLANGESPLYHPGVHVSELYGALESIRARLA
jgi:hypothetical protein